MTVQVGINVNWFGIGKATCEAFVETESGLVAKIGEVRLAEELACGKRPRRQVWEAVGLNGEARIFQNRGQAEDWFLWLLELEATREPVDEVEMALENLEAVGLQPEIVS